MSTLRPHERDSTLRSASAPDAPAWVTRTTPDDGAVFVLRDTPVLLRLSHPLDPATLGPASVRVLDVCGDVPADLSWTADGLVVVWRAQRLLLPGVEHVLIAKGLRDHRGREVSPHWSRFVPCGLARDDLRSSWADS